jgi:hypothetical protein
MVTFEKSNPQIRLQFTGNQELTSTFSTGAKAVEAVGREGVFDFSATGIHGPITFFPNE